MPQQITEAQTTVEAAAVEGKPGKFKVQLITPGWGSSGYYSAAVLKEAATGKIWPAGTRMMLDHPTWAESQDRPEGSVMNWAATLTEDAAWDGSGLSAEAEVYSPYAALLAERKDFLGVSVRASAEVKQGEAEGRKGRIIERIIYGETVDFVTKAGRGGRVLAVLESARNLTEATSNDRRDQLQRAVTDAHTDRERETWAWVRDFDEAASTVYFSANDERTYAQPYEVGEDDRTVTLTGDPAEVRVVTSYVPLTVPATEAPAPPDVPATAAGQTTQENHMAEIADAELTTLRESAGQVTPLTEARDAAVAERDQARQETALVRAATERALSGLNGSPLPFAAVKRIVRESLVDLPVKDGALDTEAFDARVKESRTEFEAMLTEAAPSGVRGFGASATVAESATDYQASESARERVPFTRPTQQKG